MKISRYLMKTCILKYLKKNTKKTEIFHEIFHRQKKHVFLHHYARVDLIGEW